jgi:hypothetical protein
VGSPASSPAAAKQGLPATNRDEKLPKRRGGLGEITCELGREGEAPVKRIGAAAPAAALRVPAGTALR